MPRSLPLSRGLTLLLTLLVAGCSSESEIAGPNPGPGGPPSQLPGSALQLRVDLKAGTVTLERPSHRGAAKDDGIRPSFALLGHNEIGASVSNIVRTSLPLLRTRIRFDLSLTNKLLNSKLVASTFPDPPTGVAQVVAFPFATEPAGLFGLRVRPSTDWNGTGASGSGAPHNFFNDAACALPGPASDCFRWEAYGPALGPGQSATRAVGFDVDPFVSTFTVYVVVAADVQDATLTGSIQGTVSSPSFGPLAGALVTASPGGQTATTDAAGAYLLQGLSAGAASVNVSGTPNSCFRAASAGVTVQAGVTSTANFSLICRRIALNFHSSFDFEIHTINQDGSGETPLTDDTELNDLDPSWSPDGTKLAFSVSPAAVPEGQGCCIGEIYVMNADGTSRLQLTNDNFADFEPAWSPDGSRIAFVSNRDGNIELYVINANGSGGLTRLTTTAQSERDPSWSPDGAKLAFDAGGKIFVMNAVPGAPQTQLANDAFFDSEPSWSPDGSKIAFFSGPGTPPGGEPGDGDGLNEIWVTNADGSGSPTQLTHNTGFDFEPDWSPDGSKIVYVSVDRFPATDGVYTMNADGTGETLLVAQRFSPDW